MDAEEIAQALRKARGTRNQREAAQDWGVAQQTVCSWESGKMFPSRKLHVAIVAKVLGVSPDIIRQAGQKRQLELKLKAAADGLAALAAEQEES